MSPQPQRIERNIVLLSDGTGNSRGKLFRTNVWRVYEALDLADPANPETPRQFAFYDDGVGNSSFRPLAVLGGALGYGLARNVRDLYGFLCRMYQPGDRIYAFGFSRGAFTIRVLVGLISNQGIVRYSGDEAELLRLVKAAYRAYRRRYRLKINYIGPLRDLRDALIAGWARLRGKRPYSQACVDNFTEVPLEFVGLWDTVAAYGMPVDELSVVLDAVVWPAQMPDARLSPSVKRAVHALSLDDERNTFHPRLWQREPESTRISQVWFAGVHSDVGGGYPDQGLSHVSLEWILSAAVEHQLRFVDRVREQQRALSDENGPINDSRHGVAGYYRYNPRRLEALLASTGHTRPVVHESVLRRIRAGQDAYAPIVLPPNFDVQRMDGTVTAGSTYLSIGPRQEQAYADGRELAFNRVWCKRVVYFLTLLVTILLVLLPLASETPREACDSWFCWASPPIRTLDFVLPAGATGWTHWYALNPLVFYVLVPLILLGLWLGGVLQRSIGDAMRRVWYAIDFTRPSSMSAAPTIRPASVLERAVQALRTHGAYKAGFRLLTRGLLPTFFGLVLFYGLFVIASMVSFNMQASSGDVCVGSKSSGPIVGSSSAATRLDTTAPCAATGLQLQAGGTYELQITVDGAAGNPPVWHDKDVRADLRGVDPAQVGLLMKLATPLRRELTEPWMAPMARIGAAGTDLYALKPNPSVPIDGRLYVLRTIITARTSGELFVYVNDAVGPPFWRSVFYTNNRGTAQVLLWLKQAPPPAINAPG
jgi:uncharacterized protein (DUF2235 family)